MNIKLYLEKKLPTIIWAVLFIWWGMRWSILETLPEGSGLVGTGILLLGVNLLRKVLGIQRNPNSIFLGSLALLSGTSLVMISVTNRSSAPPVFEIILISLGILLLGQTLLHTKGRSAE